MTTAMAASSRRAAIASIIDCRLEPRPEIRTAIRRGEGLFLGWDQARLAATYAELLPKGGRSEPDPGQFG